MLDTPSVTDGPHSDYQYSGRERVAWVADQRKPERITNKWISGGLDLTMSIAKDAPTQLQRNDSVEFAMLDMPSVRRALLANDGYGTLLIFRASHDSWINVLSARSTFGGDYQTLKVRFDVQERHVIAMPTR